MYLYDGTPKLSQRAFSFPFVIEPAGYGRTVWWTRAPLAGRLIVQRADSHRWRTVYSIPVRTHQVIERALPSRLRGGRWRAVVGGQSSLTWPV
jgi:hypothetical protein